MTRRMANGIEVSEEGMINDLEARLLTVCLDGFDNHEFLRLNRPSEYYDCNANEMAISDLPALFTWCNGLGVNRDEVGGALGNKKSRKLEFYCNVQYIVPEVETREASKKLRKIAWWLLDVVDGSLDLDGLVLGDPRLEDLDLFPRWRLVGEEPRACSVVNIRIIYPHVDKSAVTRRRDRR